MKILILGNSKGSGEVRGVQLGAALGARVMTAPSHDDLHWADVVVLLKRAAKDWASTVHQARKPLVWDALDFWAQPDENHFSEAQARVLLQRWITLIRPALVIGATEAMATAAQGVFLPHHAWPGLTPSPAREHVKVVGYQGKRKYLGQWAKAVQAECDQRGWQFVINPPDLRDCDLLVAFRDGQWDGWMCREWKSGVKIVNAMAAGRPIIMHDSAAFHETSFCGSAISAPYELTSAFDEWAWKTKRDGIVTWAEALQPESTVEAVARRYRTILQGVLNAKAA